MPPILHSIIIPHHKRFNRLFLCIWSIERSARICGISDYEIIVVDQNPEVDIQLALRGVRCALYGEGINTNRLRIFPDPRPMPVVDTPDGPISLFSKPQALNLGMERASGDVLTFLDCDAIVGASWLTGAEWLASDEGADTIRLCFRVKLLLPEMGADELIAGAQAEDKVTEWFRRYDEKHLFPRAHEAYFDPEINSACEMQHGTVFGNSQFSIRRDVLGDLRWNEDYVGAGFEDLWMIREISRQAGDSYKGTMRTKADEAMFHIFSVREPYWHNAFVNTQNRERYLNS